ncbi:MAG: hypothetical protein LBD40_03510 [Puniceicoccales bacterium]|jgi:hypothetical protein|nr:hypothetical protein [Puniceicoccales bacterium]
MKSILTIFSNCAGHTHGSHITYRAGETAVARYRLVKLSPDDFSVAQAGADDGPIGISTDEAAPGEMLDVALLCSSDTLSVKVSGPVQAGDILVPAADGCAQTLPTADGTYLQIGIALKNAATASLVEIMPCLPIPHTINN